MQQNDLQAFRQLRDLASGRSRPQVQWLDFDEKKGARTVNGSGNSNGSSISRKVATMKKPSFLQETSKKDDRVVEAETDESLRNLSQARLRDLLTAQRTLANSAVCKRLPDGGAKIHKKIAQIEAALEFVVQVDNLVLGLEINMSQLNLDEKSDGKQQLDVEDKFRDAVAKKMQRVKAAKMPYSQASRAVQLKPDGTFPGVAAKYRSGAPKFLPFVEAAELHREAQQRALTLQEKEGPSAVVGSKGSAFHTTHYGTKPDVDFTSQGFRDVSDFDDDEEEEEEDLGFHTDEEEEEEEEEEDGGEPFVAVHV